MAETQLPATPQISGGVRRPARASRQAGVVRGEQLQGLESEAGGGTTYDVGDAGFLGAMSLHPRILLMGEVLGYGVVGSPPGALDPSGPAPVVMVGDDLIPKVL